jgi:hypothetical protein
MAQSARDAYAGKLPSILHLPHYPDDGIQSEQLDSHGRVVQIDFSSLECGNDVSRQCVEINLQTNGQRGCRTDRGDCFVHPKDARPQLFVAERIEPEDLLTGPEPPAIDAIALIVTGRYPDCQRERKYR